MKAFWEPRLEISICCRVCFQFTFVISFCIIVYASGSIFQVFARKVLQKTRFGRYRFLYVSMSIFDVLGGPLGLFVWFLYLGNKLGKCYIFGDVADLEPGSVGENNCFLLFLILLLLWLL